MAAPVPAVVQCHAEAALSWLLAGMAQAPAMVLVLARVGARVQRAQGPAQERLTAIRVLLGAVSGRQLQHTCCPAGVPLQQGQRGRQAVRGQPPERGRALEREQEQGQGRGQATRLPQVPMAAHPLAQTAATGSARRAFPAVALGAASHPSPRQ